MHPQGYGYLQDGFDQISGFDQMSGMAAYAAAAAGYDYNQYWMASAYAYGMGSGMTGMQSTAIRSGSSCSRSESSDSSSSSSSSDASESAALNADPNAGKKGDYTSLLDEMKAKQRLRDEQRKLQQRLQEERRQRKREALQDQLHAVENQLRQLGESMVTVLDSNTGRLRSSRTFGSEPSDFRQPVDDRADQFARLLHAVEEYLRSREGHSSAISDAEASSKVQREWADLVKSRIVSRSVKLKNVLQERNHLFKITRGAQGKTMVSLVGAGSRQRGAAAKASNLVSSVTSAAAPLVSKPSSAASSSNIISSGIASVASRRAAAKSEALAAAVVNEAGVGRHRRPAEVAILEAEASLPEGGLLRPDQVSAIEAHLDRVDGEERVSRLSSLFNVDKAQLRPHFQLYDKGGKLLAARKPKQEGPCSPNPQGTCQDVVMGLELLLHRLTTSRASICEAMAFCLDAAAQQAGPLARVLVRALEHPDRKTKSIIAHLFLVSDILHNAGSSAKGASRYRTSFQELLPDAFEKLGRSWLHRIRHSRRERDRAERAVRKVLEAWKIWEVFPSLFLRGLEALIAEPVPEGDADQLHADEVLEKRVARWCGAADAARLPYAARLRGLCGSASPTTVCRTRLCHFERYWYHAGVASTEEEENDPWGEALRPTVTWSVPLESNEEKSINKVAAGNDEDLDGEEILSIDGESLSDADNESSTALGLDEMLNFSRRSGEQDPGPSVRFQIVGDNCSSPVKRQRLCDLDVFLTQ